MNSNVVPIDDTPLDIDQRVEEFTSTLAPDSKKSLLDTFSSVVSISKRQTIVDDIFFALNTSLQQQVKKALDLPDHRVLGITIPRKIHSYDHTFMVQSFKDKLSAISSTGEATLANGETIQLFSVEDREHLMFSIINNLCLYLSCSGKYITRQDYDEMELIIQSKGTRFSMKVLDSEISSYIDKNTSSLKHWGTKKRGFKVSFNFPKSTPPEDAITLTKLTEMFLQDQTQRALPSGLLETGFDVNSSPDISVLWKDILDKESKKFSGYYSLGGKIHFPQSIDQEKIDVFLKNFGFSSTTFKLIHANTSLLLPPSCSPNILVFYILALQKAGLITGNPDLQLAIPGRLPNRAAAMLGSVILLSSDTHTEYSPDSFKTTHDNLTGARIMAYDAGVLKKGFKNNSSKLVGRTDMLGISDINSAYVYHFLGSILSQAFYGGKYAEIGKEFMKEYQQLLERYNLQGILNEQWIYNSEQDTPAGADAHYLLIKTLTDLQKQNWEQYLSTQSNDGLIVFDIKNLLNKYQKILNYKK